MRHRVVSVSSHAEPAKLLADRPGRPRRVPGEERHGPASARNLRSASTAAGKASDAVVEHAPDVARERMVTAPRARSGPSPAASVSPAKKPAARRSPHRRKRTSTKAGRPPQHEYSWFKSLAFMPIFTPKDSPPEGIAPMKQFAPIPCFPGSFDGRTARKSRDADARARRGGDPPRWAPNAVEFTLDNGMQVVV